MRRRGRVLPVTAGISAVLIIAVHGASLEWILAQPRPDRPSVIRGPISARGCAVWVRGALSSSSARRPRYVSGVAIQGARTRRRADAGSGRRLGSRDDRPAFLAEGTPLVRAPATHRSRRRSARPRSIATRRDRSGSASYCSSRRPKLNPRANNPAVAGGPEFPGHHYRAAQLVFCGHGRGGIAGARRPSHLAASPRPRAHRLSGRSDCRGNTRHQRARGEPPRWHPACLGMRRPWPLLDLPHSGARRDPQHRSPAEDEMRVLCRIGATPNVRLACQLRPRGAVEVTPLLPPFAHAVDGRRRVDLAQGSEREIAILFVDIFAGSPRSPKAGFPMTWCSFSTVISQRWDTRSK